MFTNRQAVGSDAGGAYNRSGGIDFTARIAQRLFLDSYVAQSSANGVGDEAATGWCSKTIYTLGARRNG